MTGSFDYNVYGRQFDSSHSFKQIANWRKLFKPVGAPNNYRGLHEQKIHGRDIVRVEDPGLHMAWNDTIIFLKPLPHELTKHNLEQAGLILDTRVRGFLHSYTRMIKTRLDLHVALQERLLPWDPFLKDSVHQDLWQDWEKLAKTINSKCLGVDELGATAQSFTHSKVAAIDRGEIHFRYKYGDLRISRLNLIITFKTFGVEHFFHARSRHVTYMNAFTRTIILIFAYATVILAGMQVALAIPDSPELWQLCCQYFSYISIVFSLLLIGLVLCFYGLWLLTQGFGFVRLSKRPSSIDKDK